MPRATKERLFPVNPREPVILDLPCYKSVLDIPEPVEACALMVSSDMAVSVAKELAERKKRFNDVAAVVCMSAGFGELHTPEGTKRERDMVESLRSADIRMVGPNCVGVMNTVSGFNTNFDIGAYPSGGISLLTQSGAFGNSFLFAAGGSGRVGLNKYVSVGNMADVQMAELLMFLENDDFTRVIGIYLEGLSNPRSFFEAAGKVALAKPVVVLKSGKSELGSTAALSHTGAIAGADAIYDGAFRQFGLIRARSIAEFFDTLRAFSKQPVPTGNRFAVLTHMGGPGTMCIDEISALSGIKMATFSNATQTALKGMLSSAANIGHPPGYIDMTATSSEALHNQVLTFCSRTRTWTRSFRSWVPAHSMFSRSSPRKSRPLTKARAGRKAAAQCRHVRRIRRRLAPRSGRRGPADVRLSGHGCSSGGKSLLALRPFAQRRRRLRRNWAAPKGPPRS